MGMNKQDVITVIGDRQEREAEGPETVSIIIPCFNEEQFIGKTLTNLANQYEAHRYEIIVVDGQSTDQTRQIIDSFSTTHPTVKLKIISNPARNIPTALNLGIRASQGKIIVRMDAHSLPSSNYVRRCAELLSANEAAIVGMPWHIKPGADSAMARAIALAVSHPFGAGDAKYRLLNTESQFVDTVPFGAFHKCLWEDLGGFDESLLTNEDYDFNYRVRKKGGKILLDVAAHSDYFARPLLSDLAKQYFRYGLWKAQMLKLHPKSVRPRQLVAPAFVIATLFLGLLGLYWAPAWWMLAIMMLAYFSLALTFSLQMARRESDAKLISRLALVFFVIHFCWGFSFLLGLTRARR